jgi:hypothetical protein
MQNQIGITMLGSVGQKAKIAHNIRRLERRRSLNMHLASSREFGQSTIEVENISPSKTHRIASDSKIPHESNQTKDIEATKLSKIEDHSELTWKEIFIKYLNEKKTLIENILILFMYYFVGIIYFYHQESWEAVDCIYFITMTVTGVGYGDYHPTSDPSRMFCVFYIIFGMIFIFTIATEIFTKVYRKMEKFILDELLEEYATVATVRRKAKIFLAFFVIFIISFLGAVYFNANEGWTFISSLYWVVCSMTTVGYGDFTPLKPSSRVFSIFFIWFAVLVVTQAIFALAEFRFEQELDIEKKKTLMTKLNFQQIRNMDMDGDGTIDRAEFVLAMLMETGIITKENDVTPWEERFDAIDVNKSGSLPIEEMISILEKDEDSRIKKLYDQQQRDDAAKVSLSDVISNTRDLARNVLLKSSSVDSNEGAGSP